MRLYIHFVEGPMDLSGRTHPATSTMLLPMHGIWPKLDIDLRLVQRPEWLALLSIPPELITYLLFSGTTIRVHRHGKRPFVSSA